MKTINKFSFETSYNNSISLQTRSISKNPEQNLNSKNSEATLESIVKSVAKKDSHEKLDPDSKPNEDQLQYIADRMGAHLPKFFQVPHEFRLYNRSIVFEDNIRNIRTVGLNPYAWQITLVKMGAHFKYGKVNMEVLKITTHIEDGTVRIRWRVVTYPGNSIVFAFWQFKLWNMKESIEQYKDDWIDGFSILSVGGDGLIYKHVCDKLIPDDRKETSTSKAGLAMKLGIALGLISNENFPDGGTSLGGENWLSELLSIINL